MDRRSALGTAIIILGAAAVLHAAFDYLAPAVAPFAGAGKRTVTLANGGEETMALRTDAPRTAGLSRYSAIEGTSRGHAEVTLRGFDTTLYDDISFLPWPPLEPNWRGVVTRSFPARTYHGIGNGIEALLKQKRYPRFWYLSVPRGFAILTPIERLEETGAPASRGRWTTDKQQMSLRDGLFAIARRAISGDNARFRIFVFIVTDIKVGTTRSSVNELDIERWVAAGEPEMRADLRTMATGPATRVHLFVYEFDKRRGRMQGLMQSKAQDMTFDDHAQSLGLRGD